MTSETLKDPRVRLEELSAELHTLEAQRQRLLDQRQRERTPAELEEVGRRVAAGAPVESADVQSELRQIEARLPILRSAVDAAGTLVARDQLRAALPDYQAAIEEEVAGFVELNEAFKVVEAAVAKHTAMSRRREKIGTGIAGLLTGHPDVAAAANLREYRLSLGQEPLVAHFARERYGSDFAATSDRPTRETLPNDLDRWRNRAQELGIDLKGGRR